MFLKSSVPLKQEIKCDKIIDFIRILYTVYELYISFTEDKKSIEYIVLDKWNEMVNFEDSEEPSVSWNEDKIEFEIIYD